MIEPRSCSVGQTFGLDCRKSVKPTKKEKLDMQNGFESKII